MSLPAKVLVANRGEIAVRIIATLRHMGIGSVAVYHPVDSAARFVQDADEALELPGGTGPPVAAYLDGPAVIAAAQRSGAEAVHPGYGFLSENAGFAASVTDAGLTFIGPPAAAIRSMGGKIESKRLAVAAGIPVLPGSEGALSGVDEALAEAERIGYPVLLKASAGGGGKGMRIARTPQQCREAFSQASSEATASFGDGRIFLERYVTQPRHIEVQVLADSYGHVVHLGERECSIQRRYQKVIEESPSPFVGDELRQQIGESAVALARQVGYTSAGTVEMVMDADGHAYFLEMNTRLQVEHPVTELVTGIDIVAEQIKISSGEKLGFTQADVRLTGHAIECRVYAEDPYAQFSPAVGTLRLVRFPAGPGIRVDHGVLPGDQVTAAFDPMIAKVIGYGSSRTEAIERAGAALHATVLLGTTTNCAFLADVVEHPAFAAGATHTGFIDEHAELTVPPVPDAAAERVLVAAAVLHSPRFDRRHDIPGMHAAIGGWRP
jgi:acetyl-CoA carboxylase biotin carboxylase subunit